jgi:phosphate transport system substrate-binding protein
VRYPCFNRIITLSLAMFCGTACGRATDGPVPSAQTSSPAVPEQNVKLQGAGASFPAPLYTTWIKGLRAQHPHMLIDYQSVGSGNGVKSLVDGTVDFAASDAAMTSEEIARVKRGVRLVPMTAGSIVLSYNLDGVADLRLSRGAYVGIFLGTVTKWNDPMLVRDNPQARLPDAPIHVVVRADSSGTTYVLTKHLSEVSPDFAKSPGTNKMPAWPVGTRSKGNEGVTASIKTTPGALGYVEYGYAKSQGLASALLENKSHQYVHANTASGQAALASMEMPADMIAWNSDPADPLAYPIVTYTWMIFYERYESKGKLDALRALVEYGLTDGQDRSEALGYIPLPMAVRAKVRTHLEGLAVSTHE